MMSPGHAPGGPANETSRNPPQETGAVSGAGEAARSLTGGRGRRPIKT